MGTGKAGDEDVAQALQRLIELERETAQLRTQLGLDRPATNATPAIPAADVAAYELVARYATDMISLHDADGRYAWVSDSCAAFGWSPGELVGRGAYELIHPDDHPRVLENHRQHTVASRTSGIDYRYRTREGTYRWVSTHSSNSKGDDGLPHIVCITRDITEERTKLEQLRELVRRQKEEDWNPSESLVAVCAWCKSVRDDEGDWRSVEAHLERASGREATHGICPHCVEAMRNAALRVVMLGSDE